MTNLVLFNHEAMCRGYTSSEEASQLLVQHIEITMCSWNRLYGVRLEVKMELERHRGKKSRLITLRDGYTVRRIWW